MTLLLSQFTGCGGAVSSDLRTPRNAPDMDAQSRDYLDRVARAFGAAMPNLSRDLELISRIEMFAAQREFDRALSNKALSGEKSSRLKKLQSYFVAMQALQVALDTGDLSFFDSVTTKLIDQSRGDWANDFKNFCESERLELPPAVLVHPLRINANDPPENQAWAQTIAALIPNGEVEKFFQQQAESASTLGLSIARSMRHVKAIVRLELANQARPIPFFMRTSYSVAPLAPKAPDFSAAGFDVKIAGLSAWYFLQYNTTLSKYDCAFRPIAETVRLILDDYDPENIYYIDDYHQLCPNLSDPEWMVNTLAAIREQRPGMVVGFYGFMPAANYWDMLKPENDPAYVEYQRRNDDRMHRLGQQVDLLMPSTYIVYASTLTPDDPMIQLHAPPPSSVVPEIVDRGLQNWKKSRERLIAESRRLANASFLQPVVPFLWPQYYDGRGFQDVYVSGDLYKMAVDHLLKTGVDGLIHWDAVSTDTLWDPSFADPSDSRTSWYEALLP